MCSFACRSLKAIRAKVWKNRTDSPLFNIRAYTRNLEDLYWRMWERRESGAEPDHLLERH